MSSEAVLGSKQLIRRGDLLRVIIECLWSLGLRESASYLESESGLCGNFLNSERLRFQVLAGEWDDCVDSLKGFDGLDNETKVFALFLVFKQSVAEYVSCGNFAAALSALGQVVFVSGVTTKMIHDVAQCFVNIREGFGEDEERMMRKNLLKDLENLLPPPILLPERRLVNLVQQAIVPQVVGCSFHNAPGPVSIFVDHECGRDQIPQVAIQVLTEHKNKVLCVRFSHNGEFLASSSSDLTVIIWKIHKDGRLTPGHTLQNLQEPVSFVAWSPDDTKLLTFGDKEALKLWNASSGNLTRVFTEPNVKVGACVWLPDSEHLIYGSSNPEKLISMWDCSGNKITERRGPHPKLLEVTREGEFLLVVWPENVIQITNMTTQEERNIPVENSVTSLSVSHDGNHFAFNVGNEEIHMQETVASVRSKPLIFEGEARHKSVIGSCFGGFESNFMASGSRNNEVYIWNRNSVKPIQLLSGHTMAVNSVSWNPTRYGMVASGSDDGTIIIWGSPK